MRLASVSANGRHHAARLEDDHYVLLPHDDVGALVAHDDWRARAAAPGRRQPVESVRLRPVVPAPPKIICMGRNYEAHATETGHRVPDHPVLFAKHTSSLTGPYDTIPMPRASTQLDWEAELCVVIGRKGRDIARSEALDHVAGYTVGNDFSVRDWQNRTGQWHAGKAWDGLTPLGPHLVTDDELPAGAAGLEVVCEVDGETMQEASTDQFIFGVADLIADISVFTCLVPGDVLFTGTPAGVGNAREPKVFLRPGQTVVTRIEAVGTLSNTVVVPRG